MVTRSEAQYTILAGRLAGRTVEIYAVLMSVALIALDDGVDEHTVLLVRPGSKGGNVRITFTKDHAPER